MCPPTNGEHAITCMAPPWPLLNVQITCAIIFVVLVVLAVFVYNIIHYANFAIAVLIFVPAVLDEVIIAARKQKNGSLYFAALGRPDDPLSSEKETLRKSLLPSEKQSSKTSTLGMEIPISSIANRKYYLDNIKTIMVEFIVFLHSMILFGSNTLHQKRASLGMVIVSIFTLVNPIMCMFFFISGYFTPSSMKRKGRKLFIEDRLRRLGLPMGVVVFVIDGAVNAAWIYATNSVRTYNYHPFLGVAWFLALLMIFSLIYAAIADDNATLRASWRQCPGWGTLIMWTGVISAVWIIVCVVCDDTVNTGFFVSGVGWTWLSVPSYAGYFAAGCLAQQHKWLDKIKDKLGDRRVSLGLLIPSTLALVVVPYFLYGYLRSVDFLMIATNGSARDDDVPSALEYWPRAVYLCVGVLVYGLFTLLYTVCCLQWGPSHLNWTNPFWRTMNRSSYTVYLLHINIAYVYKWVYDQIPGTSNGPTDWFHLVGLMFVFICTTLTVWPLSYYITQAPYVKDIL